MIRPRTQGWSSLSAPKHWESRCEGGFTSTLVHTRGLRAENPEAWEGCLSRCSQPSPAYIWGACHGGLRGVCLRSPPGLPSCGSGFYGESFVAQGWAGPLDGDRERKAFLGAPSPGRQQEDGFWRNKSAGRLLAYQFAFGSRRIATPTQGSLLHPLHSPPSGSSFAPLHPAGDRKGGPWGGNCGGDRHPGSILPAEPAARSQALSARAHPHRVAHTQV